MKNSIKQIISLLMCFIMLIGIFTFNAPAVKAEVNEGTATLLQNNNADQVQFEVVLKAPGASGSQIKNIMLNIVKDNIYGWGAFISITEAGNTGVRNLPDGTYKVGAIPLEGGFAPSEQKLVTIEGGILKKVDGVEPKDKILEFTATNPVLTGKVYLPDGTTTSSAIIVSEVSDNGRRSAYMYLRTDDAGLFKLGGLEPGKKYTVCADIESSLEYGRSEELEFFVDSEGNANIKGQISLNLTEVQIKGTVTNPDGVAESNFYVIISRITDGKYTPILAFPNKMYTISNLPDGTYSLVCMSNTGSYTPSERHIFAIENKKLASVDGKPTNGSKTLDLKLTNPQVTGTVVNKPDDKPVSNALVFVYALENAQDKLFTALTTSSGAFKIGGLSSNRDYILKAEGCVNGDTIKSINSIQVHVDANGNAVPSTGVKLELAEQRILFTVAGPNGEVVNSFDVNLVKLDTNQPGMYHYDNGSSFRLPQLMDGEYKLRVVPDDINLAASICYNIKIAGNKIIELNGAPYTKDVLDIKLGETVLSGTLNKPGDGGVAENTAISVYEITENRYELIYTMKKFSNGLFKLGGFEPNKKYALCASAGFESIYFDSEPYLFSTDAKGIPDTNNISIILRMPQITGRILDVNGNKNSNDILIMLESIDSGYYISYATANNREAYKICVEADGVYTLRMVSPDGKYTPSFPETVEICNGILAKVDGKPVSSNVIDFVMEYKPQLKGTVTNPADGSKVSNCRVDIIGDDKNAPGIIMGALTDANGEFIIGGLLEGDYTLKAIPDYYNEYVTSSTAKIHIDSSLSYTGAAPNLVLQAPQVAGSVKTPEGLDLDAYRINIISGLNKYSVWDYDYRNTAGKYSIWDLRDGDYLLNILPLKMAYGATRQYSIEIAEGKLVKVDGKAVAGNVLNIVLDKTQIYGKVTTPDGKTYSGGGAVTISYEDKYIISERLRSDGSYYIGGLDSNKTYNITAHPAMEADYIYSEEYSVRINEDGNYEGSNPFDIALRKAKMKGRVVDRDGNPVNMVNVIVKKSDDASKIMSFPVFSNGSFNIGGFTDGTYSITAQPDSENKKYSESKPVTITLKGDAPTVNGKAYTGDNLVLCMEPAAIIPDEPGGKDPGTDPGKGNTTDPVLTPTPVPGPKLVADNDVKPEIIKQTPRQAENGGAVAEVKYEDITKSIEKAQKDKHGHKNVELQIAELKDAKSYEQKLPGKIIATDSADTNIKIVTGIGEVLVRSNMLSNINLAPDAVVGISITKIDTKTLPGDVRKLIGDRPAIDINLTIDGKKTSWSNTEAPVTVSLDYKPTENELKDPEHIVVWYIDDNNNAIPVPNGKYDVKTGKVTFTTVHMSKYVITYVSRSFSDISNSRVKRQIEVLASKGILSGTGDNRFKPMAEISRADFMIMLVKALGLDAKVEGNFNDVKQADYYYNAVGIAKKLGIASGVGGSRFNPTAAISRQDAMVLITKALAAAKKIEISASTSLLGKYSDSARISAYAKASVAVLASNGLLNDDKAVNPLSNATREQIAELLYNAYNK